MLSSKLCSVFSYASVEPLLEWNLRDKDNVTQSTIDLSTNDTTSRPYRHFPLRGTKRFNLPKEDNLLTKVNAAQS